MCPDGGLYESPCRAERPEWWLIGVNALRISETAPGKAFARWIQHNRGARLLLLRDGKERQIRDTTLDLLIERGTEKT